MEMNISWYVFTSCLNDSGIQSQSRSHINNKKAIFLKKIGFFPSISSLSAPKENKTFFQAENIHESEGGIL